MAAGGVPVVALLAIAATELASLSSETRRMQDAADTAALDAATQLSFSPGQSVLARAEANARAQLAGMEPRTTLAIKAELVANGTGVRLGVNGSRMSFFGNLLPPGGFKTAAAATATTMNSTPLCVVALETSARLRVEEAEMDAGECLVHGNGDVETANGGQLRALAIHASGSAAGAGITPAAYVGAKRIEDPFASVAPVLPSGCADIDKKFDKVGTATLPAGRHCGHLDIEGTVVTLARGVHVFNGELQLKVGTRLVGDDVLVVFEQGAEITVDDPSVRLDLKGLRTGAQAMHGFVFITAPSRTERLDLPAGSIERLEGVFYARNAPVRIAGAATPGGAPVPGATPLAEKSKWTVVVAKALEAREGAAIVVNADYLSSAVPVPTGVGDKVGREVRLAR